MSTQGFSYSSRQLYCEKVALQSIAEEVGTPTYIYSSQAIRDNYKAYDQALAEIPHEIHYAVKANSSLAILALLAREGAGFDIVSGGELFRVLRAGGDPSKVVYSGVGKTLDEMEYALKNHIKVFQCESLQELEQLQLITRSMGVSTRVALRINPNIDAKTHPYIATGLSDHKFGISLDSAERIYLQAKQWAPLEFTGVSCHIGSQIFAMDVFEQTLKQCLELSHRLLLQGVEIKSINLGGGLGVAYDPAEDNLSIHNYCDMLCNSLQGSGFRLGLEPGRSIVAQAGVLLTKVLYRKDSDSKRFAVVDGAMNDLLRPALYRAHHEIMQVKQTDDAGSTTDVVGPVCESGDFLATDRILPAVKSGDLLAVATAGAYGFVQSSNYNARPRAAEVLVENDQFRVIRKREDQEDLVRGESL